jgi:SAM-dependent methyltransferase
VLQRIESPELTVAGEKGARSRWDKGWRENLADFKRTHDLARLTPKYVRRGLPLRLDGEYVIPSDNDFELNWFGILRTWLFRKYLRDVDYVYEFGCGTGYNLALLAKMFPDKTFFGLDWSEPSTRIVETLSKEYGWDMHGIPFDLSAPDTSLEIKPNSAVITFTALEQMGNRYGGFLAFLMKKRPAICIHVEPIAEWYDQNSLHDYLAMMFHRRRRYLEGFAPDLVRLAGDRRLKLVKMHRSHFGSLYTDSYSQVIWKPS